MKLLDVLTSLPVSHAILPCAVCFATSGPANHAICSYIVFSGYASGPIRICLFIDYIITCYDMIRIEEESVLYRLGTKYVYKKVFFQSDCCSIGSSVCKIDNYGKQCLIVIKLII